MSQLSRLDGDIDRMLTSMMNVIGATIISVM